MNPGIAIAAALSVVGGLIHSLLGERLIFSRLDPEHLPGVGGDRIFTQRILRAFWHLVSVAWWGFAVVLGYLSSRSPLEPPMKWVAIAVAATFLVSSLVALLLTRGRHFSWGVLLVIAIIVLLSVQ